MLKRITTTLAVLALAGFGAAVGLAGDDDPPGQGPCGHGATEKPCKPDPQPGHGADCEEHGQQGGVNEDHCAGTTTGDHTTTGEEECGELHPCHETTDHTTTTAPPVTTTVVTTVTTPAAVPPAVTVTTPGSTVTAPATTVTTPGATTTVEKPSAAPKPKAKPTPTPDRPAAAPKPAKPAKPKPVTRQAKPATPVKAPASFTG